MKKLPRQATEENETKKESGTVRRTDNLFKFWPLSRSSYK